MPTKSMQTRIAHCCWRPALRGMRMYTAYRAGRLREYGDARTGHAHGSRRPRLNDGAGAGMRYIFLFIGDAWVPSGSLPPGARVAGD